MVTSEFAGAFSAVSAPSLPPAEQKDGNADDGGQNKDHGNQLRFGDLCGHDNHICTSDPCFVGGTTYVVWALIMREIKMQRIDKFLSEAGVASRKEIRGLLRQGRVTVNGETVLSPDRKIDETCARVFLDGIEVAPYRKTAIILFKPTGYVTSTDDPQNKTVMELIPERYRRLGVVPVGRLDKETEGLLILTNDGDLNHRMTSPRHGIAKRYYAEHEGTASPEDVAAFLKGITLRDGHLVPERRAPPSRSWEK